MSINETINLIDMVSGPAKKAAEAVDNLDKRMQRAREAAAKFGSGGKLGIAESLMAAEGEAGKFVKTALLLGAVNTAVEKLQKGAKVGLVGALKAAGKETDSANASMLLLGGAGNAIASGASAVGAAGAAAFGAITTAALASAAAVGAVGLGMGALLKQAHEIQDLKGAESARLGMLGFGKELQDIASRLATNVPQSRQEIVEWADSLQKLGVTDLSVLQFKLQSMAAIQATMGKDGVSVYESLQDKVQALAFAQKRAAEMGIPFWQGLQMGDSEIRGLRKMGVTLEEVAAQMRIPVAQLAWQLRVGRADAQGFAGAIDAITARKGDPEINRRMATLPVMIEKTKDQLNRFLEGIDFKPLLGPVQKLLDLFNEATPTGQAMQVMLQTFGDAAAKVGGDLADGLVWALKEALIIGLDLVTDWGPGLASLWDALKGMAQAAVSLYEALSKISESTIGKVLSAGSGVAGLAATAAGAVVPGVGVASGAAGVLSGIASGISAGSDERRGLMAGAARDESQAAIDAYKEEFGIKSPSRVMMGIGDQIGAGLRIGMGRSMAGVGDVASGTVDAAATGATGAAPTMVPTQSSGASIRIEPGAIVVNASSGQSATEIAETVLTRMFERIAVTQGLA